MQVAEEIKQINVSLRVGLITEGPSITITNSPPLHYAPQHTPSPAPPPFSRPSASFPSSWRHKSCVEIRRKAKRNFSRGSIHHSPSSLRCLFSPPPTPPPHPDTCAGAARRQLSDAHLWTAEEAENHQAGKQGTEATEGCDAHYSCAGFTT